MQMDRAQFAGQDLVLLLGSLVAGFVESREEKRKRFIIRIDGYRNGS